MSPIDTIKNLFAGKKKEDSSTASPSSNATNSPTLSYSPLDFHLSPALSPSSFGILDGLLDSPSTRPLIDSPRVLQNAFNSNSSTTTNIFESPDFNTNQLSPGTLATLMAGPMIESPTSFANINDIAGPDASIDPTPTPTAPKTFAEACGRILELEKARERDQHTIKNLEQHVDELEAFVFEQSTLFGLAQSTAADGDGDNGNAMDASIWRLRLTTTNRRPILDNRGN